MKYILRFYDWGALATFSAMMACILIEVLSRNLLKAPTAWAEESSRLFFIWSVFLGSASAWYRGSHIIIQVLTSRLVGRTKLFFTIIVDVLSAIFLVCVWVGTIIMMYVSREYKTTALDIRISVFYLALLLGITGILIFHFNHMIQTFRKWFGAAKEEI